MEKLRRQKEMLDIEIRFSFLFSTREVSKHRIADSEREIDDS